MKQIVSEWEEVEEKQVPIEESQTPEYNELKSNPGFLDIDNIEKNARDILEEHPQKDLETILKEEDPTPSEEIAKELSEYGIDAKVKKEEEETNYRSEEKKKFFKFSPGELIEKEDESPLPPAPSKNLLYEETAPNGNVENQGASSFETQNPKELTGFDFKYNTGDSNSEMKNMPQSEEIIKGRVQSLVTEFKQAGSKVEVEEIDLEDQLQIIIKISKKNR